MNIHNGMATCWALCLLKHHAVHMHTNNGTRVVILYGVTYPCWIEWNKRRTKYTAQRLDYKWLDRKRWSADSASKLGTVDGTRPECLCSGFKRGEQRQNKRIFPNIARIHARLRIKKCHRQTKQEPPIDCMVWEDSLTLVGRLCDCSLFTP